MQRLGVPGKYNSKKKKLKKKQTISQSKAEIEKVTSVATKTKKQKYLSCPHVPDKIKLKYFQSFGKKYSRPHDPGR